MTRIAVLGGGPAGLLTAALIRERRPDIQIDLLERNAADQSVGFGVVFSAGKLARLGRADARLAAEVGAHGRSWTNIDVSLKSETVSCHGLGFSSIARRRMLDLLQARAAEAGVALHFGADADPAALLAEYDLLIGADGVASRTRALFAEQFAPSVEVAHARYIWFGAARALPSMTFLFERSDAGWFAAHAYPFDDSTSTFLIETDDATLRRAGLGEYSANPQDGSDEASRLTMQALFAAQLGGAELLSVNSRWLNFRTLRTASWSHGRAVLLGDAAHTAHFSVGSGTTMALEDALVLADEVSRTGTAAELPAALASYEQRRRPGVATIQNAATSSMAWWENFGSYTDFEPRQFAVNFLTRSGRVSFRTLDQGDPAFGAQTLRWFGLPDWPAALHQPFEVEGASIPSRVLPASDVTDAAPSRRWITAPEAPAAVHAVIDELRQADPRPSLLVIRRAGPGAAENTAALLLGELARLQLGVAVALVMEESGERPSGSDAPFDAELAATHILAGRTDLIVLVDPATIAVPAGTGPAVAVHSPLSMTAGIR